MAAPMRLTIYSSYWSPVEGGAERQLRHVAQGLLERDWSVSVITQTPGDSERAAGLQVHRISPGNRLTLFRDAHRIGRASQPDVVLGSLVSALVGAGMVSARTLRVPSVIRLGGSNLSRFQAGSARRAAGRLIVGGCAAIVVNAPHLVAQVDGLRLRRPMPIELIRNGVQVSPSPGGRRGGPVVALYYTNGGIKKNDADFISIVRACPEVRFRVVGRTEQLPELANLERVGWCDDLGPEFAGADVVLNTSVFEGSPNFCLQALAARRPVLGFDNAGMADLAAQYPADVRLIALHDTAQFARVLTSTPWRECSVTDIPASMPETVHRWDVFLRGLAARTSR